MGEARTAVEAFYDAFSRGDIDAALDARTEDIGNVDPSGTIRGRDAFRQFVESFKAASPDAKLNLKTLLEDGNVSASEGTFTGTFTGPLRMADGEILPTGNAFELWFVEINEVENGKIRKHRVYYDQMAFLAALGVQPPA
jgi:predicted ester cyclase